MWNGSKVFLTCEVGRSVRKEAVRCLGLFRNEARSNSEAEQFFPTAWVVLYYIGREANVVYESFGL